MAFENKVFNNFLLVGNACTLIDKQLGHIIDQYENVVRFNNFLIKGYEKDVGTKITHISYNDFVVTRNTSNLFEDGINYLIYNASIKPLKHEIKKIIGLYKGKVLSRYAMRKYLKDIKYPSEHFPSTGFICILYYLYVKRIPQITLTNFDFQGSKSHHWKFEKQYVDELILNNKIKILI